MAEAVDIDVIDFEDEYDKADPIDDVNLDKSINELNILIREQEELENRIRRTEWWSTNEDEQTKLEQQIAFTKKERRLYIMRVSKTILLILHRGFDKIKQGGRVMALDENAAEKLYNRLHLIESDEGTYKTAFKNEKGTLKGVLSPRNRWLAPTAYLRIFGNKFIKILVLDKPKGAAKSKISRRRKEQTEWYIEEIDDDAKQFKRELNELPTSEDNQDNIMLQDII